MSLTKSEVLNKANDIVNGDRQNDYGEVENNFQVIADLWTAYLKAKSVIIYLKVVKSEEEGDINDNN